MDRWVKKKVDPNIWEEQDQLKQYANIIEKGDIQQLRNEEIDGTEYYVLEIQPSQEKILEILKNSKIISEEDMDSINAVKNYTGTFWINKETWVAEKAETEATVNIEKEGKTIVMSVSTDATITEINQPVSIEIPAAAKNARDLTEGVNQEGMKSATAMVVSSS